MNYLNDQIELVESELAQVEGGYIGPSSFFLQLAALLEIHRIIQIFMDIQ